MKRRHGSPIVMRWQLRKVGASDLEFIWQLRVTTMKEAISNSYGWDEETQRGYAEESLEGNIVLVNDRPVGIITIADRGDQLHLVWVAILPEMQRRGLGSELIEYCQKLAIEVGKPLTLQTLRNSPAISLYRRLGFKTYASNGPHKLLMQWDHNAAL